MSVAPFSHQPPPATRQPVVPPLENGDHLTREEFERRWEAMPHLQRAELLEGIVYMAAALRQEQHGRPHGLMMMWLGIYATNTPGVDFGVAASVRLGPRDEPQPDGHLRLPARASSTARLDKDGYVAGAPDLVVEVAASTASLDMNLKLQIYERFGVREYVVWRTLDEELDWFVLKDGKYELLPRDSDGWRRSRLFPGLWLQPDVLLHGLGDTHDAMMHEGLKSLPHAEFKGWLAELTKPASP
jgi:Uma2 family endonuclease